VRRGEQRVYGEDCLTKVSTSERVLRRWPQASKAEVIVCQTSESDEFANAVMDYAQFKSATALSAAASSIRVPLGEASGVVFDPGGRRQRRSRSRPKARRADSPRKPRYSTEALFSIAVEIWCRA
jgi:hypothetical protein